MKFFFLALVCGGAGREGLLDHVQAGFSLDVESHTYRYLQNTAEVRTDCVCCYPTIMYVFRTPYSTRYSRYHPQLHRVSPAKALLRPWRLAGIAITGESWSARRNDNECAMPNGPLVVHASYLSVI